LLIKALVLICAIFREGRYEKSQEKNLLLARFLFRVALFPNLYVGVDSRMGNSRFNRSTKARRINELSLSPFVLQDDF
jgi:hypothetical protein